MTVAIGPLLRNAVWTVGSFGVGQALRLIMNIILARLLAPELFGVMSIVNSLRTGIELMSDVGIGQNVIVNKDGNNPEFYNTAWTLQFLRGLLLWPAAAALAVPLAHFYNIPELVYIVPITALISVFAGASSIGRVLLHKNMQISRLNAFETIMAVISFVAHLTFAYISPTVWSLVWGGVCSSFASMMGSYFLMRNVKQRFSLSKKYTREILHFGKWIFLSSVVYFLSTNFDRLYLAKIVPLELLGVYGIARSISEMLGFTMLRLGNYVLFPLIASHSQRPRADLRADLKSIRMKFLCVTAIVLSVLISAADLPIKFLYDQRYAAASWMLPVLTLGAWFSTLATINEATLLGLGKPSYSAAASGSKFAALLIGLPLGLHFYGLVGGLFMVSLSDLWRYIPILAGQRRQGLSFGMQDLFATVAMFLLVVFWEVLRWAAGYGTSFENLPLSFGSLF
jgi:O-antigen/teichoic acid export membrane protein